VFPNYYDGDNAVNSAIYWGSSAGYSPTDTTALPGARSTSAAIADLDGDGWPDIVLGSAYDGDYDTTSYVYHGSSAGYSASDRTALSSTYGVYDTTVADVDQDGYPEIVFATLRNGTTGWYTYGQVWWGGATGYSSAARDTVTTGGASVVSTADVNEDGYPDVIWPGYFDGSTYATTTYVYHGSAAGLEATPDTVPSDGAGRRLVVVGG
jgi:FG-GAP-like repeat